MDNLVQGCNRDESRRVLPWVAIDRKITLSKRKHTGRGFRHGRDTHWERRWAFWTLVLVFLYAVGDEIHQLWVPSRSGRFQDSLLDFFGGTCALAVLYLRYRMDQREPGNGYNHSK